jgi:hypothetical protein
MDILDFNNHVDYTYQNPVRYKLVKRVSDGFHSNIDWWLMVFTRQIGAAMEYLKFAAANNSNDALRSAAHPTLAIFMKTFYQK